jgi:phosphatidylinositol alpha-1,6-mannosyltransferase
MNVLAVFPELHVDNPGGIQAAGQMAWTALHQRPGAHCLEVSARQRVAAMRAVRNVRFGADIVLFWHLDLLRLAPLMRGQPQRVVFLHGIEAWRRRGPLTRALLRHTAVIANSHYTLARAQRSLPMIDGERAQIVHLGWGQPLPSSMPPGEPPAALMIGRLDAGERYKGHHEVIRAWPRVREQMPDAQLWIVGDGDLRSELETLAADSKLADAVRFFGRSTESEKEALLQAARCLVLPSTAEGFGLVYLEAMRAGRPCLVGSDAGREVVDPPAAGLTVDPVDAAALSKAIVQLLRWDDDWQRRSHAARERYAQQFTATHFQQRLLHALDALR